MTHLEEPPLLRCMQDNYEQLVESPLVKCIEKPTQVSAPDLPLKDQLQLSRVQSADATDNNIVRPGLATNAAVWTAELAGKAFHDPSQAEAEFHIQTTQEALIQGPPGTGKRFIANADAKIVHDSLQDGQQTFGCRAVIGSSNDGVDHAFDSPSEAAGLHASVRSGSQSKNEPLAQYAMKYVRSQYKSTSIADQHRISGFSDLVNVQNNSASRS